MFRRPERAEKQDVPTGGVLLFAAAAAMGTGAQKAAIPHRSQKNILDTAESNQRQTARILRNTGYGPLCWSGFWRPFLTGKPLLMFWHRRGYEMLRFTCSSTSTMLTPSRICPTPAMPEIAASMPEERLVPSTWNTPRITSITTVRFRPT